MTRKELHAHPLECCYEGDPGIVATNPDHESDFIYFVSNKRDGLTCSALLRKYPQYRFTYAFSPSFDGDEINFEKSGITNIKNLKGDLIFKKPTKFSL